MSMFEDLVGGMAEALRREMKGDGDRNRIDPEELDRGKQAPDEDTPVSMVLRQTYSYPNTRLPQVDSWGRGREARQDRDAAQRALWLMVQQARRTALGIDSIGAVNAHVFMQSDRLAGAIDDEYHGRLRRASHNKLMAETAEWCIRSGLAGMRAIAETYPRRLADYLG